MAVAKKAFFFTFLSILIVTIFIVFFSTLPRLEKEDTREISSAEAAIINDFTKNIEENYFHRVVYAISILAFDAMLKDSTVSDAEESFNDIAFNGTLNKVEVAGMKGHTIPDWINKTQEFGKNRLGIETYINISEFTLSEFDPNYFYVEAELQINTSKGSIEYDIERHLIVKVPVEGFEDPVWYDNSMSRKIKMSELLEWNHENALELYNSGEYAYNSEAPSFLQRVERSYKSSSKCCGIESFINYSVSNVISVDYAAFSQKYTCLDTKIYSISDFPVTFLLDNSHVYHYALASYSSLFCEPPPAP